MKKLFAYFVYLFACGVWLFFLFFWLHCTAWGILVPNQRLNPQPLQWKHRVLLDYKGSPKKVFFFFLFFFLFVVDFVIHWNETAMGLHKERKKVKSLSRVQLCVTPWTVAHQTPPSMGFSRQEYWNGLSFLSPGVLPDPGIEPRSPTLQADSLLSKPQGKPKQF